MQIRKSRKTGIDFIEKNRVWKYIVLPIAVVSISTCVYFMWRLNNQNGTYKSIDYIREYLDSTGKINDFQNKIGWTGPDCIHFYPNDSEGLIRIEFGKVTLTWEPEYFYTEGNANKLKTIGITYDVDENDVLHMYWAGEELEPWVITR